MTTRANDQFDGLFGGRRGRPDIRRALTSDRIHELVPLLSSPPEWKDTQALGNIIARDPSLLNMPVAPPRSTGERPVIVQLTFRFIDHVVQDHRRRLLRNLPAGPPAPWHHLLDALGVNVNWPGSTALLRREMLRRRHHIAHTIHDTANDPAVSKQLIYRTHDTAIGARRDSFAGVFADDWDRQPLSPQRPGFLRRAQGRAVIDRDTALNIGRLAHELLADGDLTDEQAICTELTTPTILLLRGELVDPDLSKLPVYSPVNQSSAPA